MSWRASHFTPDGEALADNYPLPESETVGQLEANINQLLSRFQWGVISVEVGDDGLRLRHRALPVSRDDARRVRWCNAFCAILEGLYSRWLQGQGAVRMWCYSVNGCSRFPMFSSSTSIHNG